MRSRLSKNGCGSASKRRAKRPRRSLRNPVFNDRDGFIYITRHCLICDAHIDDI